MSLWLRSESPALAVTLLMPKVELKGSDESVGCVMVMESSALISLILIFPNDMSSNGRYGFNRCPTSIFS